MSWRSHVNPLVVAAPAGAALAAALVTVVTLSAVAQPSGFEERTSEAEAAAATVARALGGARSIEYPAGAVCVSAGAEAPRLQTALTSQARSLRLESPVVEVTPAGRSRAAAGLSPLAIRLQAQGGYAEALAFIARLEEARPMIYLDTVDLVSKTSAVSLSVTGRAYCAGS